MNRWLIAGGLFFLLIVVVLFVWIGISYDTFPKKIKPGSDYRLKGQRVRVPFLPHKTYKTSQTSHTGRAVPMLPIKHLEAIYDLTRDTLNCLERAQVEVYLTGGTLISATLWKSFMVMDDDIDMAVDWKYREYLFSSEFATIAHHFGLEAFYLRGSSTSFATKEGAAVRLRKKGTWTPTVDLFFHRNVDGRIKTVHSWYSNGVHYYPDRLSWKPETIFPLRQGNIMDISVPVPHDSEQFLTQQYGEEWSTVIKSPQPLTMSHTFAFLLTNVTQSWRVGKSTSKPIDECVFLG